ncbi:DUF6161 domain-containing protein [Massilia sp. R2A-15]|uniref:DUF6161 domain-containing protein n=1 Tax=Massilia sp. R2A-15 TaxID=3064278 RepID=UPI002733E38F|nr:DUF6161 domain-containing protein [Massilia sp. R2A-15]WLI89946.1 DUF6161 domain-containing protein [Massilia sp. R2A-15]
MPDIVSPAAVAAVEPLFKLDLEANGGVFAPKTVDEIATWVTREVGFWSWLDSTSGAHREVVMIGYRQLAQARASLDEARPHQLSNPQFFTQKINEVRSNLTAAFLNWKLPHSSSRLGKRVDEMRKLGPSRAVAYLYTQLPSNASYPFESRDLPAWRGFIEGLAESLKITDIPKSVIRSATASVEELKAKLEETITEKREELNGLHRSYEELTKSIATKDTALSHMFTESVQQNQQKHDDLIEGHKSRMAGIESVFKEKMTLRGPVEYWSRRKEYHEMFSGIFGLASFFLIAVGGGASAWWAADVFAKVPEGKAPAAWQIASLGIVVVFVAWAIRLVIRLFLSHSHLGTDAAERVVMTQTYLALLEDDKLKEETDRSLILGALFRPTSDGMVKDENIPHPMLDAITKLAGK